MITSTVHTDPAGVIEVFDAKAYRIGNPNADIVTCGTCGRSWDDAHVSMWTPTPSGRCPFEYEHSAPDEAKTVAEMVDSMDRSELIEWIERNLEVERELRATLKGIHAMTALNGACPA
jgi:hypothetical protein